MLRDGALLWLGCALLAASSVQAHVASNGFLDLQVQGAAVRGSIELAVRDVELAVATDANHDGRITWGELQARGAELALYLTQRVSLTSARQPCPVQLGPLQVNRRVDGVYAWFPLSAQCARPVSALQIGYRVLAEVDPSHRGLLRLSAGSDVQTAVLGASPLPLELTLARPALLRTFLEYLQAGVWHIWSGIDHLLFLVSLLLPAVLLRRHGRWVPQAAARPAFLSVLGVVTAFTLAHSITLSLAAFNVVHLPSRLTESVIALSIVVAALNNIFPLVTESRARIAFGFGLLHGFGFASVLAEMGLPSGARLLSLLAFNLGIESGQLAVVAAVMPVAYFLRRAPVYRQTLLPWGSAAIAALALVWFFQRALLPM